MKRNRTKNIKNDNEYNISRCKSDFYTQKLAESNKKKQFGLIILKKIHHPLQNSLKMNTFEF